MPSENTIMVIHLAVSVGLVILLLVVWGCIRSYRFRSIVCWLIARWFDPDEYDQGTYAYDFCIALRTWLYPVGESSAPTSSFDTSSVIASQVVDHSFEVRYSLGQQIGTSRCYDVYRTVDQDSLVKIARDQRGIRTLGGEHKTLLHLRSHASGKSYAEYLPANCEQTRVSGMPAWVYKLPAGVWRSAESITCEFLNGLPGEHIAWMFNRILEVVGFAHEQGVAHSAIMPRHLLFETNRHSLQLVDWPHAKRIGRQLTFIPKRYRAWYPKEATILACPQTDIYMSAKSALHLAGGDTNTNELPRTIPAPIRQFLKACLLESTCMRPDNAWELHEEFREILELVYGALTFQEFPSAEKAR